MSTDRPPLGRRLASALARGALAALPVAVAIGAAVRAPLPSREGAERLPGLSRPARVEFDRHGIPHVRAATAEDAWRVLGWLHAGDRLVQMELRRRAAAGRLAELVPGAIALDVESRRLRLDDAARREWRSLSVEERRLLEAYASGVTASIRSRPRPFELALLGAHPEPWTPLDSLRFLHLLFTTLSGAYDSEDANLERIRAYGTGPLLAVLDAGPGAPTFVPPEAAYPAGSRRGPTLAEPERPNGSNAWAISGRRTASGQPILAGDPHLATEIPGIWYAAHLASGDGLDVAGLTTPGLPGVVVGHNGRTAWSMTMFQADDADLFLERIDASGTRYETAGGERALDVREETIRTRDGKERPVKLLATLHGPLVGSEPARGEPSVATALAWAPYLASGSFRAFRLASRATDPAEVVAAWKHYEGPPVNVCWATADGHVGVLVAGAIPSRRAGDGRLPVPGWAGRHDWDGLVPYASLPRIQDPPEGFVATANDDWSAVGPQVPYPGEYAGRERVDRIRDVLDSLASATVADCRELQGDVLSTYGLGVRRALEGIPLESAGARRAVSILSAWDGRARRRGPSLLLHAFLGEQRRLTFGPREARLGSSLPVGWGLMARMIEGAEGTQRLWDDPGTPEVETREALVDRALGAALDGLERTEGSVPEAWNAGRAHAILYRHPFSGASSLRSALLDVGPVDRPGDPRTVNVSGFRMGGSGSRTNHAPSARILVDLGDPDASRVVLPLGQSGQFQDPRYDDQLEAWSSGRDFPFPFSERAIRAVSSSTLRLEPAP